MTTNVTNAQTNWLVQILREILSFFQVIYNGFILSAIIRPLLGFLEALAKLGVFFLTYVLWVLLFSVMVLAIGKIAQWALTLGFMQNVGSFINSEGGTVVVSVVLLVVSYLFVKRLRTTALLTNHKALMETSAVCSALWILSEQFHSGVIPLVADNQTRAALVLISMTVGIILFGLSYWYKP